MEAPRVYPVTAWSRVGHRCDECGTVVRRGEGLVYLTAAGQFCSRTCESAHTLNDSPAPLLEEAAK